MSRGVKILLWFFIPFAGFLFLSIGTAFMMKNSAAVKGYYNVWDLKVIDADKRVGESFRITALMLRGQTEIGEELYVYDEQMPSNDGLGWAPPDEGPDVHAKSASFRSIFWRENLQLKPAPGKTEVRYEFKKIKTCQGQVILKEEGRFYRNSSGMITVPGYKKVTFSKVTSPCFEASDKAPLQ